MSFLVQYCNFTPIQLIFELLLPKNIRVTWNVRKVVKATTGHIDMDAVCGSAVATYAHRLIGTASIFILYK